MSPVLVLCGPSGAGKTDVLRAVAAEGSSGVDILRLTTTRPPRPEESETPEYEFVSQAQFLAALARDEFLDHTEHHGVLYGMRHQVLQPYLDSRRTALVVYGTSSAIRLKKDYPDDVQIAFVYPGDLADIQAYGLDPDSGPNKELYTRLRRRVSTASPPLLDVDHWLEVRATRNLARVASLLREINRGFDVFIVPNRSGRFDDAVAEIRLFLAGQEQLMGYSNANLPSKRVGASALFVNSAGEVLIVKPTYRKGWLTPGGTVEINESPHEGCRREVTEELGVAFPVHQLLCVAYRSAHDNKVENLQFVFWGGQLNSEQIAAIRVPEEEIREFRFCRVDQLDQYLNPALAHRVVTALVGAAEHHVIYLENGEGLPAGP